MNEFVNDTYIYKCFLGIDDSDFISGEVFDSIDSNGDGQDGDEPQPADFNPGLKEFAMSLSGHLGVFDEAR